MASQTAQALNADGTPNFDQSNVSLPSDMKEGSEGEGTVTENANNLRLALQARDRSPSDVSPLFDNSDESLNEDTEEHVPILRGVVVCRTPEIHTDDRTPGQRRIPPHTHTAHSRFLTNASQQTGAPSPAASSGLETTAPANRGSRTRRRNIPSRGSRIRRQSVPRCGSRRRRRNVPTRGSRRNLENGATGTPAETMASLINAFRNRQSPPDEN
eukprot:gb/GECG01006606.1/.p1 GENE.gb/GECG01006606.1/~~gb/GECG01006606.1/.p1  ORF type:complete len:214 (+),score=13.35 gb/GECG01006606.1/:1-642(+)